MTTYQEELGAVGQRADLQINQLITEVGNLNGELAAMEKELGEVNEKVVSLMDQIGELEQKIVELEKELDQGPLFGSSFNVMPAGYTSFVIGRTYLSYGDKPVKWDEKQSTKYAFDNSTDTVWISAKESPEGWLDLFLASAGATGKRIIYTQNHEFGNDGPNNTFPTDTQLKEYQRRWALTAAICDKYDYVDTAPIMLGSQNEAQWELTYPTVKTDFCGFDRYNFGIRNPKAYVNPKTVYGGIIAFAKKKGQQLVVGETGTGKTPDDTSGSGRALWAKDARAVLLDGASNVYAACWWSSAEVALDKQTADAWFGK
jgi:hypothetical protein